MAYDIAYNILLFGGALGVILGCIALISVLMITRRIHYYIHQLARGIQDIKKTVIEPLTIISTIVSIARFFNPWSSSSTSKKQRDNK